MNTNNELDWHQGELAMQAKAGVPDNAALAKRNFITDSMSAQHQDFFTQLPFMVLASLDETGRPWATLMTGQPGFVTVIDAQTLQFDSQPVLYHELGLDHHDETKAGMLGIDLATRRRNRVNGTLRKLDGHRFELTIDQCFGNCPKYIQQRTVQALDSTASHSTERALKRESKFSTATKSLICKADTFYIASRSSDIEDKLYNGVDASHRGGKPGFVSIDANDRLTFPDFIGNHFFNTLGNIELDNRVGLLFIEYTSGDAVFVTGTATVDWTPHRVERFRGAERIIDITPTEIVYAPGILPMNTSDPIPSPFLVRTGSWDDF